MTTTRQAINDYTNEIFEEMKRLSSNTDEQQRNIYILSGVLGGVDIFLIIAVIVLIYATLRVKKELNDAEIEKQVEEEINAQKYAAYTGEEMHRKMLADSTPAAVPLSQQRGVGGGGANGGADSEYAFNAPFVDDRILPPQPGALQRNGGSSVSKLNRY